MRSTCYRVAERTDVPAMARIRAAEWGTEGYWTTRILQYLNYEADPRQALRPRVSYVALRDDLTVGLIAGHLTRRFNCDGELQWIDVVHEYRGTGVAAELLRLLATWFVEQNASKICIDVEPGNARARRFYARFGAVELNPHWLVWDDIKSLLGHVDLKRPGG